jgi:hypothetical protein
MDAKTLYDYRYPSGKIWADLMKTELEEESAK